MILRSGRLLSRPTISNMSVPPPPPLPGIPQGVITLVNTQSAILPFKGYVDGRLEQSVETWISAVDSHLASKQVTSPDLQLQTARSFLDLTKGDVHEWTRLEQFRDCQSWDDFKPLLRRIYGREKEENPVMMFRSILKLGDRRHKTFASSASQISDAMLEWRERVKRSNWTANGTDITIDHMCHLIKLTLVCSTLPERLLKNFDINYGPDVLELDIVNQIRKNAAKVPDLDPTILSGLDLPTSEISASISSQPEASHANPQNRHNSFKCYNCGKPGHVKTECKVKYCCIHQSSTHKYADCRKRKNMASRTPFKNSSQNSGHYQGNNRTPPFKRGYSNDNKSKSSSKHTVNSVEEEQTGTENTNFSPNLRQTNGT